MAAVLEQQGRLDEAMRTYQEALRIKKKTLGDEHSSVGDTLYNMALLREGQGRVDEALVLFRQSHRIYAA